MNPQRRAIFAEQYSLPCLIPAPGDTTEEVIADCRYIGAVRTDDEGGEEFVVQLRAEAGPELWTETALRGSLPTGQVLPRTMEGRR